MRKPFFERAFSAVQRIGIYNIAGEVADDPNTTRLLVAVTPKSQQFMMFNYAPQEFSFTCNSSEGLFHIYNLWEVNGERGSQMRMSGMKIEEIPGGCDIVVQTLGRLSILIDWFSL